MAMESEIEKNTTQPLLSAFRSEDPWIKHEEIFRELYCVQKKTLKEVKEEMERNHGFSASTPLSTYETKLRDQLMLRKKLSKEEWPVIEHCIGKRRSEGKNSQVFLNKVPLPNHKIQKEIRRNKHTLQVEESTNTTLPFGVNIKTPPALSPLSPIQNLQRMCPSSPFLSSNNSATIVHIPKKVDDPASSNSSGFKMSSYSKKRPRASNRNCHSPLKRARSSFPSDSWESASYSGYSRFFEDGANSGEMFGHELPYIRFQGIIYSEKTPSLVRMLRPTGFASQIFDQPLRTTFPGTLYHQHPRIISRTETSLNKVWQVEKDPLSAYGFLKTALFFVSNGLLNCLEEMALIEDLEKEDIPQATFDVTFSIDTPTLRATWERLIQLAIELQSSMYRPLLVAGCRKRAWIAGLAPILASAAILLFDSAEAIEHIRRLKDAHVSLLEESEVYIDLVDGIWDKDPLQQALNKADANIVKELLSDSHILELEEEGRKERALYIPEQLLTGFAQSPETQRLGCLEAMIDCGLRLREPGDRVSHDCKQFGCLPPLYCSSILDQLLELDFMREYEMLLPYSRTFSTSVMVCGTLNAAINGDYALSEYLAARTSSMDEDESIIKLKEIALWKSVFLEPYLRYTALDCLLRAGVDPNIPHLSPTFTETGRESHVEWAIERHDFECLAMLLSNGLIIDSVKVLRSLFGKIERNEERVQPLSRRLWTLRYLRDNGLDMRNHGMVALAAFLGYWSKLRYLDSDSVLFRPLEETLTLFRFLLDAGADANMVIDEEGNTILHATVASRSASPALITALIKAGANVQALNLDGRTVLNRAVESYKLPRGRSQRFSRLEIVECLLNHGAVTTCQGQGSSILEELAIHAGFHFHPYPIDITEPFTMLLSQGACINNPNREAGPSALASLIQENMPSGLIKIALDAGADVNAPAVLTNGLYPVQAAVEADNIPVLMDLLNRGADINAPAARKHGHTALQLACLNGSVLLVQDLLARGADVNAGAAYEGGLTALQAAAFAGKIDVAQILIESGARLDLPPAVKNGDLPLDGAARMGRLDMVQYLMNLGAISQEPGTTKYDGAIKLAEKGGHYSIADMMREYAARLDEEQS